MGKAKKPVILKSEVNIEKLIDKLGYHIVDIINEHNIYWCADKRPYMPGAFFKIFKAGKTTVIYKYLQVERLQFSN